MNRHKRMLMLGVAFMIVLSLTINSASAARPPHPRRQAWSGNQIPDPTQGEWVPRGNHVLVKGALMICNPDPYKFGDIEVDYEIIDWMIIFASPGELYENPMLGYTAKRFGRFTWYGEGNNKVAEGGFRFSEKDQVGCLWAKGDGFVAKGTFWINWQTIDTPEGPVQVPTGTGHQGWYMITGDS